MSADKIDALILAGEGKGYIPVEGLNKALIDLRGRPVIEYVLQAMEGAELVGRIHLVGPLEKLGFLSAGHPRLRLFPQGRSLVENVLSSYESICPGHDRHILVITSDIPFVRPSEIDRFIRAALETDADIVLGLASRAAMSRFYPAEGRPGIRPACCHFRQGAARLNNMFLVRVPAAARTEYADIIYGLRYQKRPMNFARLILGVLGKDPGQLRLLWTLMMMQVTLQAHRLGLMPLARAWGRMVDIHDAEAAASRAAGASVKTLFMDSGGAVMDIDDKESLRAARERLGEFMSLADETPEG